MVAKLDDIYDNPSYHAEWYLQNITGNMKYLGSAPSEINNSSTTTYLGAGVYWTITYHIMKLMQRQEQHYLIYCKKEDRDSKFNEYYNFWTPI